MIYTSYFAKIKNFPDNYIPIAISRGIPKWYDGLVYQDLAPSFNILKEYENSTLSEEEKEVRYDERYKNEILGKMDLIKLGDDINRLLSLKENETYIWAREDINIVFLCYEKSEESCHRKLVSEWLNKRRIPCREISKEDFEKFEIEKEEKDAER